MYLLEILVVFLNIYLNKFFYKFVFVFKFDWLMKFDNVLKMFYYFRMVLMIFEECVLLLEVVKFVFKKFDDYVDFNNF